MRTFSRNICVIKKVNLCKVVRKCFFSHAVTKKTDLCHVVLVVDLYMDNKIIGYVLVCLLGILICMLCLIWNRSFILQR